MLLCAVVVRLRSEVRFMHKYALFVRKLQFIGCVIVVVDAISIIVVVLVIIHAVTVIILLSVRDAVIIIIVIIVIIVVIQNAVIVIIVIHSVRETIPVRVYIMSSAGRHVIHSVPVGGGEGSDGQ